MTLRIEAPEIERKIRDAAARRHLTIESYLLELVTTHLPGEDSDSLPPQPFYATASTAEWIQAIDEWANSHDTNTPLIPDEALRREKLYEDDRL